MTFTLLATDPRRGLLGVVTASKSLALGRSVPAIDPTSGAVASQAWGNGALRHHMLAALRDGSSPQDAVARIPALDAGHAYRQVGLVDHHGKLAAHTGDQTTEWAGHLFGPDHLVLGNLLTGPEVLSAMSETYLSASPGLPETEDPALVLGRRMIAALIAGEAAGGDARGKESSALMVAKVSQEQLIPPQLAVDLRVDHHAEPVTELASLLELKVAKSLEL